MSALLPLEQNNPNLCCLTNEARFAAQGQLQRLKRTVVAR
ncbi:hypothetical protein RHBI111906_00365 [Rhodothermus bifroesti]|nr:hypothetical protein HRbin18_01279 [bacterium HR18]